MMYYHEIINPFIKWVFKYFGGGDNAEERKEQQLQHITETIIDYQYFMEEYESLLEKYPLASRIVELVSSYEHEGKKLL